MAKTKHDNNTPWDTFACSFIKQNRFTRATKRKDIFDRVNKSLQMKYKSCVAKERIEDMSRNVTDTICIRLKKVNTF